jgi:hypothetical protein
MEKPSLHNLQNHLGGLDETLSNCSFHAWNFVDDFSTKA